MSNEEAYRERLEFFRWLVIIGVANMVILAVLSFGLISNFNNTTDDLRKVQAKQFAFAKKLRASNIASCNRGSIVAARDIIITGQLLDKPAASQKAAFKLLPFRDCEKTEELGQLSFMSNEETNEFISGIARVMGVTNWDKRNN